VRRALVAALVLAAAPAAADPDRIETAFVPGAFAAATAGSWAQVRTGYDGARAQLRGELIAEARVLDPLAIRVAAIEQGDQAHPFVAVRGQVLRQARHGVDGAIVGSYEPDGFRHAEGKLGVGVQVARDDDGVATLGELTYAEDDEGDDGQLAGQVALLVGGGAVRVGGAARARAEVLASDAKRVRAVEPVLDAALGPIATVRARGLVLSGELGVAAVQLDGARARLGAIAELGLGVVF
jgi:hypothetical protein